MFKRNFILFTLMCLISAFSFGQAGALRDFVGMITIHYHPDVIELMTRSRDNWEKSGHSDVARSIDNYLKGISGTGFVYVAEDGTCYILTNDHVVAQSDTLSITFEKQDGSKTTYDRLRVLTVDEDKDIAILVFEPGVKPFAEGLSFSARPADEGGDVFAAGFPGIGNTAIWQFSRGNVSNAAVRLPKDADSDETIGPFIQHTAQVDPGNSGGPLLVVAEGVPTGYAVVGINTLSARWRQAANYAIPINLVENFINSALNPGTVNERQLISLRVDEFLKGIKSTGDSYNHISGFLSNACAASNAEYAIVDLLEKGTRRVIQDIDQIFIDDPVGGMSAAVGWTIESSMRARNGSISISLDSINTNDKGNFTVAFNVNGTIVESEWIKEYGIYRMNTYGNIATGDKERVAQRMAKLERDLSLRTNYFFSVSAGFAYVGDHGAAFHGSIKLINPFYFGIDVMVGEQGYFHLGANAGFDIPIRVGSFGIVPFLEVGLGIFSDDKSKNNFTPSIGFTPKVGLWFTTAYVPGLYVKAFYQYNLMLGFEKSKDIDHHGTFGVGVGYSF